MTPFAIALILYMNAIRTQPLHADATLMANAQNRAEFLCAGRQFSHQYWQYFFTGVPYKWAGENLAQGFYGIEGTVDPRSVEHAWEFSPEHLANLENEHFSKIGVGEACGITVALFVGD